MTTARFKVSPSCLIASITKRWLADNWWMLAIAPAISLMLAAMGDIRFMFVALIMIFTVIPPAVFIIYFFSRKFEPVSGYCRKFYTGRRLDGR